MYGFTGTWQGQPDLGAGIRMGGPSMAVYINKLFESYGVQSVVGVG